ncbi:DUF7713 domain-containing protein, partial [Desulfofundulus sp.]
MIHRLSFLKFFNQSSEESTGPDVVTDGKRFSWEEFGRMVYTFEGWNFK